jgi:hypothetical protein
MRYAEAVDELVGAGADLGWLEHELERVPVTREERDALWLYAWSSRGLHRRGRPARTVPVGGRGGQSAGAAIR